MYDVISAASFKVVEMLQMFHHSFHNSSFKVIDETAG